MTQSCDAHGAHCLDIFLPSQRAGAANSAPAYGFGSLGSGQNAQSQQQQQPTQPQPLGAPIATEASLDAMAARGEFTRVFELCAQHAIDKAIVQRYAIMHAARLVQEERYTQVRQRIDPARCPLFVCFMILKEFFCISSSLFFLLDRRWRR